MSERVSECLPCREEERCVASLVLGVKARLHEQTDESMRNSLVTNDHTYAPTLAITHSMVTDLGAQKPRYDSLGTDLTRYVKTAVYLSHTHTIIFDSDVKSIKACD